MKHWEKNNPADRSQILLSDQQECTPPFGNQQNVELTELEHSLPCYILSFSAPTTHLLPLQQAIYTNFWSLGNILPKVIWKHEWTMWRQYMNHAVVILDKGLVLASDLFLTHQNWNMENRNSFYQTNIHMKSILLFNNKQIYYKIIFLKELQDPIPACLFIFVFVLPPLSLL